MAEPSNESPLGCGASLGATVVLFLCCGGLTGFFRTNNNANVNAIVETHPKIPIEELSTEELDIVLLEESADDLTSGQQGFEAAVSSEASPSANPEFVRQMAEWNRVKDRRDQAVLTSAANRASLEELMEEKEVHLAAKPKEIEFEDRTWFTFDKQHSTEGLFVSAGKKQVEIQKNDGQTARVMIDQLIADDRVYIAKQLKAIDTYESNLAAWNTQIHNTMAEIEIVERELAISTAPEPPKPSLAEILSNADRLRARKKKEAERRYALSEKVDTTARYQARQEWFDGGTLMNKTGKEWRSASAKNKLASSANMVAALWNRKKLVPELQSRIRSMDDMKVLAQNLSDNLDAAFKPLDDPQGDIMLTRQGVAGFATILFSTMGWIR